MHNSTSGKYKDQFIINIGWPADGTRRSRYITHASQRGRELNVIYTAKLAFITRAYRNERAVRENSAKIFAAEEARRDGSADLCAARLIWVTALSSRVCEFA